MLFCCVCCVCCGYSISQEIYTRFCCALLCCGYTLTDFPISIRLTSLALWQSDDCPSASKATLMNMDKYFIWIHYERLHNHNKAKHNKTVCIFLGIYCTSGNEKTQSPPCAEWCYSYEGILLTRYTVYPKKYAHGFGVLCFVVVMQSFIMNSHEVFIHIHQGCFVGTGAIVRLPQCQWSKPDGYGTTVYPKKYAHGFVVLCFVVVMQSFIMNSHEVFIHIHQGCFAGTGAIVRLPQCQWSKPDGYGKISQCITTTKHSKAKTVCIFLGIYCICYDFYRFIWFVYPYSPG